MWWISRLRWSFAFPRAQCHDCRLVSVLPRGSSMARANALGQKASREAYSTTTIASSDTSSIAKRHKNVPYYGDGVTRQPVPLNASTVSWNQPDQPADACVVRVALLGLPNAGKSSLMNALIQSPIAAVSPKVNTTREDIKGIMCVDNVQLIFTDCPGILESHRRRKFCGKLVSTAWKVYEEADVCLFIIDTVKRPDASLFKVIRSIAGSQLYSEGSSYSHDAGRQLRSTLISDEDYETDDEDLIDEEMGTDDGDLIDEVAEEHRYDQERLDRSRNRVKTKKPVGLVLNKIDLADHKKWVKSRAREMKNHGKFDGIFYTSAKHGIGFAPIVDFLKSAAKPGFWLYPPDMLTTMSKVQIVEQMVRTYIYCWFNKELPYRVGQKVIGWTIAENGSLIIEMELYVRNDKAAKVICGIQGRVIKQLQKNVSHRLSKMWNEPVFLFAQVKVKRLI